VTGTDRRMRQVGTAILNLPGHFLNLPDHALGAPGNDSCYELTIKGRVLAVAKAKLIRRSTAERLVSDFLQRVEEGTTIRTFSIGSMRSWFLAAF
jgi:hypothetical protein